VLYVFIMIEDDILKLIENRMKFLEKQWKSYDSTIKNKEPDTEIGSLLRARHSLYPYLSVSKIKCYTSVGSN